MAFMTRTEIAQINDQSHQRTVREEQVIVRRLIRTFLSKGYLISVWDGEAWALKKSNNSRAIIKALRTTDEDTVVIRDSEGERLGFVYLVWGNGEDVIADCTAGGVVEKIVDEVIGN